LNLAGALDPRFFQGFSREKFQLHCPERLLKTLLFLFL